MTRPAEPLTILDEDGESVWAPAPSSGWDGAFALGEPLPVEPSDSRILDVRAATAWLDEQITSARAASTLGFFARFSAWFSGPRTVSTALAVGTYRMRLREGRLFRHWVALGVPPQMPPSLVPPDALPQFDTHPTARIFYFPDDDPEVRLVAPVTLMRCTGSDIHWWRELTSRESRQLVPGQGDGDPN